MAQALPSSRLAHTRYAMKERTAVRRSLRALITTLVELLLAPLLVGASTLAARRWHDHVGGVVSAFPAIVGPLLLITVHLHGSASTARAATGTLVGLVGLSAFATVYGRVSQTRRWPVALTAGWIAAAVLTVPLGTFTPGLPGALILAGASLTGAVATLPQSRAWNSEPRAGVSRAGVRMALTFALVAGLAVLVRWAGPAVGGMLAGLPVLASVLTCATHRHSGAVASTELLRGMLAGMGSFVAFCAVVAFLVVRVPSGLAFAMALLAAVVAQVAAVVASAGRRQADWACAP
ncbi:MAG: hypothetical protein QOF76_2591 [Solirubrobacteraceae bacterium]|nr:hypothetical protein [Solirubrobacteraceae bacterium]